MQSESTTLYSLFRTILKQNVDINIRKNGSIFKNLGRLIFEVKVKRVIQEAQFLGPFTRD